MFVPRPCKSIVKLLGSSEFEDGISNLVVLHSPPLSTIMFFSPGFILRYGVEVLHAIVFRNLTRESAYRTAGTTIRSCERTHPNNRRNELLQKPGLLEQTRPEMVEQIDQQSLNVGPIVILFNCMSTIILKPLGHNASPDLS